MSTVYANFFNSQTISLLLCLHEAQKMSEKQELDIKSDLVGFMLNKILSISDSLQTAKTNSQFEAQLFSITNNQQFLQKYQASAEAINCFNKFYGEISNILKNLRSLRNTKLEQSNLIDFFVRRLYIYFQKLDFKQIVEIYNNFMDYMKGVQNPLKQHEFMLTKSIEEVKFNMENYGFKNNPNQLEQIIEKLAQDDHTFKTSYLKGIAYSQKGAPAQSSHFLRRYFDKNLANLFQDRMAEGANGNKINHCILSGAYASLQLEHLDQCLQSISEGLRISQNNADEESINNCIIYLYHVAERLGKFRQQILLAQHAITHSLNQNNLLLTLYSCLSCSLFQRKYDCADSSLSLLKTRQVSWKDALHFAKKKLHSHYQNNCRNIFHLYRNLLIPSFIHKLAIIAQIPGLKNLLLNPYYSRKQFLQLSVYKQFVGQNPLSEKIRRIFYFAKTGFSNLLEQSLYEILEKQQQMTPSQRVKIWAMRNEILFRRGSFSASYHSSQELIQFCQSHGFIKSEFVDCLVLIARVLSVNELHYDALIQVEEAIRLCVQHNLKPLQSYSQIVKAKILLSIGNMATPTNYLKDIEEKGTLKTLNQSQLRLFYETKLLLNSKALSLVKESFNKQTIENNIFNCYKEVIKLCWQQKDIIEGHEWIHKMNQFASKHPVFMSHSSNLQVAEAYSEKVIQSFKKCEIEPANSEQLGERVVKRLSKLAGIQ